MKQLKFTTLLLFLFTIVIGTGNVQSQTIFEAKLTGAQEALPVISRASGNITAELNGSDLVVYGAFSNLESPLNVGIAGGVHIHMALAGDNGGVVFPLTVNVDADQLGGTIDSTANSFSLTASQIDALQNHMMYVNVHSLKYPAGEIRGQLLPSGSEVYLIHLFGSNEVPSVMSEGAGALILERNGNTLRVSGSYSGLESDVNVNIAGGAHLHTGLPGENGGVELVLTQNLDADLRGANLNADSNTFTLTTAQVDLLERRALYANIHTVDNPSGELRGNVTKNPNSIWRAHLAGYNEIPLANTNGYGQLQLELNGNDLTVTGSFSDLVSPLDAGIAGGAHLHVGMAGENGGVRVVLDAATAANNQAGTFEAMNNMFTLSDAIIDTMLMRGIYANLHTEDFQAGEIRGQILPTANYYLNGFMSGSFEVPSVLTTGQGFVIGEVLGNQLTISGSFNGLGSAVDQTIAGGAHLHNGLAGENGGVVTPISATFNSMANGGKFLPDSNMISLDSNFITNLRERKIYSNIHTLNNGMGELRAQLLPEARSYYAGILSGGVERPMVMTEASGAVMCEWTGTEFIISGSFANLSSEVNTAIAGGAHLHRGLAGQNGGIFTVVNPSLDADNLGGSFDASNNTYMLSAAQMDTIMNRMTYLNIHTQTNGSGELRAQISPLANNYFSANLVDLNTNPSAQSSGMGGLLVEQVQSSIIVSGSFAGLDSKVATNIAGGVHIHLGDAISTGGVEFVLTTDFNTDTLGGAFMAANNQFTLDQTQLDNLMMGMNYANLHTEMNNSGALRGQLLKIDNSAPTAASITAPANGANVDVDAMESTPFEVNWNAATDEQMDVTAYVWQLALDTTFDNLVYSENLSDMLSFSTNHKVVDSLLEENGVAEGAEVTLYHRVVSTDASIPNTGMYFSINLTRSNATGTSEKSLAEVEVFPNPATNNLTISSGDAELANAQLIDLNGRVVKILPIGRSNQSTFDISDVNAGIYFLQLQFEDKAQVNKPIMIE